MKEIAVSISVTYSKSSVILVEDDYKEEDLEQAVRTQCPLPNDIIKPLAEVAKVKPAIVYPNYKPEVFEGWIEDDFAIIEE